MTILTGIPGLAALASLKRSIAGSVIGAGIGIPGLAALASLKPEGSTTRLHSDSTDSGACCPGLIEAGKERASYDRAFRIPGLAALASLKLLAGRRVVALRQRIPGLAALASLKRCPRAEPYTRRAGFRGLLPWPH